MLSHSAVTGASHSVARNKSLNALASPSDSDKLSRAQTRFDIDELESLNAKFRQELGYGEVATRLKAVNTGGREAFGNAVRGNLCVFDDVKRWWAIVSGEITPELEARDVRAAALSAKARTSATWGDGIGAAKKSNGVNDKALFHPLRLALAWRGDSLDLKRLLPVIGWGEAVARLCGAPA